jgi:gliding motility-associated lipoprotein GldD
MGLALSAVFAYSAAWWWASGSIVVLLGVSASVSGSEIAFFSLKPQDRLDLKESDDKNAVLAIELLTQPDPQRAPRQLLATILVLNNAVNIVIILISTVVMRSAFPPGILSARGEWAVHIFSVTFLIVLFGEVIPKIYASRNSLKLATRMARPLSIAQRLLIPVARPMVSFTALIDRRLSRFRTDDVSVADLEHALELTDSGERTEDEKRILTGIVSFGKKDVKQIMTPRVDVTAFAIDTPWDQLLPELVSSGHSRVPVYSSSFDEIEGVLYIKDLTGVRKAQEVDWTALIRKPFFVTENMKIDDLLRDFQNRKVHLAVVVDEYGGTSGIVTLEDVIEEIVGEISDEFDQEQVQYSRVSNTVCIFQGKTMLVDMYRILNVDGEAMEAAKGESDSIGGFMVEQAGKMLEPGDGLEFSDLKFTVEAADRRRISQVRIEKLALFIALLVGLAGCREVPIPRPQGFFRIALHDTAFAAQEVGCGLRLDRSTSAGAISRLESPADSCWFDLVYPAYDARIHCTYAQTDELNRRVDDAFRLAYEHEVRADAIGTRRFSRPDGSTGVTFHLAGDAASSLQFVLTDGKDKFLRGALYFNRTANGDSTQPVTQRIAYDVQRLMESVHWPTSEFPDGPL